MDPLSESVVPCNAYKCGFHQVTVDLVSNPSFINQFKIFFYYSFCLCLVFFAACGLSVVMMSRICALVVVRVLLTAVASLVMEHDTLGMWASVVVAHGLCSCRFQALEHRLNSCSAQA